jgi:predicted Zn-dependent peptidase
MAGRTNHILGLLLILIVVAVSAPALAREAAVPVKEFSLDNGMKLLLVERHASPTVAAGWVAHVGSVDETTGITGIAHLFEHMMFKGTSTIGTRNSERESQIMAQLDALRKDMEVEYDILREAKLRGEISGSIYEPENRTDRLAELVADMRDLQESQRDLIVKDEYEQVYTSQGGSSLNAGTSNDFTFYFANVPANKLELWFWMESDRLLDPVFREFYSERDVVREERRMRVESDPTAKFEEQFDAMFWGSVPYHHPVVGWPSDVEAITRAQADQFFATYYAPNNITAVLVGDFETEKVLQLARKYFERVPRGITAPPTVITEEIPQLQERRMHAEADTNPSVHIRWHAVPHVHRDVYSLEVLSEILSDRTGRLYRSLVEEKNLATGEPYAYSESMKLAGYSEIGAELTDGATHEAVEGALLAEIERLKTEAVPDRELQKVKNRSLANSYRRLRSNMGLLIQIMMYDSLGDWRYLNDSAQKIQQVSPEDVMAAANRYFTATGRNVLWFSRKEGTEEDPELAALSGQGKTMAKQAIAQIEQIDDFDELTEILSQMEAQASQVPPEFKPALDLVIRRTKERLEQLQIPGEEG